MNCRSRATSGHVWARWGEGGRRFCELSFRIENQYVAFAASGGFVVVCLAVCLGLFASGGYVFWCEDVLMWLVCIRIAIFFFFFFTKCYIGSWC